MSAIKRVKRRNTPVSRFLHLLIIVIVIVGVVVVVVDMKLC